MISKQTLIAWVVAAIAVTALVAPTRAVRAQDPTEITPEVQYEMATVEARQEHYYGRNIIVARICYFDAQGCRFETVRRRDLEYDFQEAIASGAARLGQQGFEPVNFITVDGSYNTYMLFRRPVNRRP